MAELDMNNSYQEVGYDKCPTYIMHTTFDGKAATVEITDGDNTALKIETGGADSVKIDGVEYYNKAKVDSLISSAVSTAKTEIQSWANGQFQTKGA